FAVKLRVDAGVDVHEVIEKAGVRSGPVAPDVAGPPEARPTDALVDVVLEMCKSPSEEADLISGHVLLVEDPHAGARAIDVTHDGLGSRRGGEQILARGEVSKLLLSGHSHVCDGLGSICLEHDDGSLELPR